MLLSKYWWRGKGGSWEAPWGLAPKDGKFEVITMAEPFSIERRKLMRFMGAKVIITKGRQRQRHGGESQGVG